MRILVTGASGLIGRALAPALSGAGHEVIPLRRVAGAPAGDAPWWDPEAGQIELRRATPLDAVVHLAGEPVAQRWTAAAKDRIRRSRCEGTALLAAALGALPQPPSHFLCASAIGFYGDRGEEELDENSPAGTGFLAA